MKKENTFQTELLLRGLQDLHRVHDKSDLLIVAGEMEIALSYAQQILRAKHDADLVGIVDLDKAKELHRRLRERTIARANNTLSALRPIAA